MTSEKKQSGLDIDLGNRCSKKAYDWTRRTFATRLGKLGQVWQGLEASFASVVEMGPLMEMGPLRLGITSDGIGTKIEIAERMGLFRTLGYDLTAMVCDDLAANGIEPMCLSNILDVDHLDESIVDELLQGLSEAAISAGIALTGGEIAELGNRISGWGSRMHFNWCATAIGVMAPGVPPIDGSTLREGDRVVSIRERGLRSNGFSLARRVVTQAFGETWHEAKYDASRSWGEALLTPSLVCSPLVSKLINSKVVPRGIANITGGGIPDKLGRVLRVRGLGAELNELHEPVDFMRSLQEMGKVPGEVAYRNWNMGNAMLLVLAPEDVDRALQIAAAAGFTARLAGKIDSDPSIRIQSKTKPSERLRWDLPSSSRQEGKS
jgi:phosphoribosylformylglycinamidine cyclo-ligase